MGMGEGRRGGQDRGHWVGQWAAKPACMFHHCIMSWHLPAQTNTANLAAAAAAAQFTLCGRHTLAATCSQVMPSGNATYLAGDGPEGLGPLRHAALYQSHDAAQHRCTNVLLLPALNRWVWCGREEGGGGVRRVGPKGGPSAWGARRERETFKPHDNSPMVWCAPFVPVLQRSLPNMLLFIHRQHTWTYSTLNEGVITMCSTSSINPPLLCLPSCHSLRSPPSGV